jgi:hypothetical protein
MYSTFKKSLYKVSKFLRIHIFVDKYIISFISLYNISPEPEPLLSLI